MNRTSSKGARARGGAVFVPTLEPKARRAVHRFVRVLAHCGLTSQAIEREVTKVCRGIPVSWLSEADRAYQFGEEPTPPQFRVRRRGRSPSAQRGAG